MKFGAIRRRLFVVCLSVSIALHIGTLWLLYANPMTFSDNGTNALMKPAPIALTLEAEEEKMFIANMEKALEDTLNDVALIAKKTDLINKALAKSSEDSVELSTGSPSLFPAAQSIREEELDMMTYSEVKYSTSMPPLFDPKKDESLSAFILEDEFDEEFFTAVEEITEASPDYLPTEIIEAKPHVTLSLEDDYSMTREQFAPSTLPLHQKRELTSRMLATLAQLPTDEGNLVAPLQIDEPFSDIEESTNPKLVLPNSVDYLRNKWVKRSLAEQPLPKLDHYGFEDLVSSVQWEDGIDVDVSLMATPEGNKYIFSLSLEPGFTSDVVPMQQNFYFLIDRSSSITKQKFNRFKRAVSRSMAALREGDSFNIILFDKKVTKLSDRSLAVTPKTIQRALDFLEYQSPKTHFAANELYSSIGELLPKYFDPAEMHSVILITDGNTLLKGGQQKRALLALSKRYNGDVQFYTAASGKGNNLVLLDLLSYSTAGKLLYSDTNASFPRKLVRLVKDLHYPIAKEISVEVSAKDPNATVTIFPKGQLLPPLFAKSPYVVVGTVDELCDLTLFFQGRSEGSWLNIRKDIKLDESARGGKTLEKLWASTQSKVCYERFLKNGHESHLKEAVQLVSPYQGMISQGN